MDCGPTAGSPRGELVETEDEGEVNSTAAEKVFGITELCEHILQDVDARDLFRFLSVNRAVNTTISASKPLLRRMHLEPDDEANGRFAPVFPSFFVVDPEHPTFGYGNVSGVIKLPIANLPPGTWKDVLLVQSPQTIILGRMTYISFCYGESNRREKTVRKPVGLTLRNLVNLARRLVQEHGQCCQELPLKMLFDMSMYCGVDEFGDAAPIVDVQFKAWNCAI
ncbi:hypothetical protein LTR08_009140 [Meristemomyces frigidus]|nr:hypothetical protein LTR08_009140 [Meristemomyces frigidus]